MSHKVWNEELVRAMECRMNTSIRLGKKDQHLWARARDQIRGERKDIYRHASGQRRIVNLPSSLAKRMKAECEAIIRGETPVVPDRAHLADDPSSPAYTPRRPTGQPYLILYSNCRSIRLF